MTGVDRMRAYRARRYAEGWHYIRGRWTDAPRQQRRPGEEPPHGTFARYRWKLDPCRCADCRAANSARTRIMRRAMKRAAS